MMTKISVRDLIRGEVDPEYFMLDEEEFPEIDDEADYTVTVDDLLAGIRQMKEELYAAEEWVYRLGQVNKKIWPKDEESENAGRLLQEESVILCARRILEEGRYDQEEDDDALAKSLPEAEKLLLLWLDTGEDLSRIREYPDAMLRWLTTEDDKDSIDRRNTRRQNTFVKALDELCSRGDPKAVAKRGCCYYFGTDPYPQNWEAARDAFLYVHEKTGEAWPANMLGYIYYYGRSNGGVPEYENAFHWFSIGHAGGIDESTCKLGDLFANGNGIPKNEETAWKLYSEVYQKTLQPFLDGSYLCKFADAAIRMGNCYRDGIGDYPDPETAYGYYLQARKALQIRMQQSHYFGDDSVKARLDDTMEKMRKVYTDHEKTLCTERPVWMEWLLDKEHRLCRMTWETSEEKGITLRFTRVRGSTNGYDWILATFPAGDYCNLVRGITIQTEKNASLTIRNDVDCVVFDDYRCGFPCRLELMLGKKVVAEIRTNEYCFDPESWENRRSFEDEDPSVLKKDHISIIKDVYRGKEEKYLPQVKRPLRVSPMRERKLKEYRTIFEFQEDYPTREQREKFVGNLMNDEIDELVNLCHNIQGKIYYENLKKKEKVFEFRKTPIISFFGGETMTMTVYDGPGAEKYVEYSKGSQIVSCTQTFLIGRKEIQAIRSVLEDNVLFEAEYLEDPYNGEYLEGTEYYFVFAVKGCKNKVSGSNIGECREDYQHFMNSAHAIQVLEEIRDILVPAGVPKECFSLDPGNRFADSRKQKTVYGGQTDEKPRGGILGLFGTGN